MSNMLDTTNKSAFHYSERVSDKIIDICTPLKRYLGIKCFGYLKIFKDASYLSLHNGFNGYSKEYFEHITTQGNFTQIAKTFFQSNDFYHIWPNKVTNDPILSLLHKNNIWHGFTMYHKTKEFVETFNFTFDTNSDDQTHFFLNNMEVLKKFSEYFKLTARGIINCSDKSKLAIYKDGVDRCFFLPEGGRGTQTHKEKFVRSFLKEGQSFGFYNQINFSRRETECLELLSKGRTAKEIGCSLNLSHRTVESYFENAKNKVGCNYKSQLLDAFSSNKINS